MRILLPAAAAALALSISGAAQAAVTLEFKPAWGSAENTGAAATATFSFSDLGGDVLVSLVLANITGDEMLGLGATQAALMGIAFDLPDSAAVTSFDGGDTAFGKLFTDLTFAPMGTFDQGVGINKNFQGGNPNGGLKAGQTTAPISFTVLTGLTAAEFEAAFGQGYQSGGGLSAAARFQAVNAGAGSDKVFGLAPPMVRPPSAAIPEPRAWVMMILGFGGVGAVLRTRRRRVLRLT